MESLHYTALERLNVTRPVDRLDFIAQAVAGKTVLDLGALDETAFQLKRGTDRWLHARLCSKAKQVLGIDNSSLVPAGGLETAANGRIINANIFDLRPVVEQNGAPDIVVAGELIEHLPNTSAFLASLKNVPALSGKTLIISTPNACSWHNGIIGLLSRESTHQDHLQIYSYKTLRTLFERAQLPLEALVPYHVRFDEMIENSSGFKKIATESFMRTTHLLESLSPLLSAGWIGIARI
ncbi:MAG: hypothetical protein EON92_04995 [Burkholderiales bacterium]|nr:MAG: hypothetical protein EON92_04995 [Burkholderiales bacterium]